MPRSAAPVGRMPGALRPEAGMAVAQVNIARPLHPLDDPRMASFVDAIETVNAIAERSDGFVWRLKGDGGHTLDVTFEPEPGAIVNLSVWRDVDALQKFVWTTLHRRFVDQKPVWFHAAPERDFAMWWVDPAHRPTLDEAAAKLSFLRREGSTRHAFGWDHVPPVRWLGQVADGSAAMINACCGRDADLFAPPSCLIVSGS